MDIKQELKEWLPQLDRHATADEHRMVKAALAEIERLESSFKVQTATLLLEGEPIESVMRRVAREEFQVFWEKSETLRKLTDLERFIDRTIASNR
jgi:hypothetical protein